MKYCLITILGVFMIIGHVDAQKNKSPFKLSQPQREHKSVKSGFVGKNPSHKYKSAKTGFVGKNPSHKYKPPKISYVGNDPTMDRPKTKYMKLKKGRTPKSPLYIPDAKIKKPKKQVKFLAADNSTHASNIRKSRTVNDKQMVLPKMRGDKKTKMPQTEFIGINPNMGANNVKEKHNSDIQYKTAYKFGKKGGLDKTTRRH